VNVNGNLSLATASTLISSNLLARDFAGGHELRKATLGKLVLN
jgi:hypothetical protein